MIYSFIFKAFLIIGSLSASSANAKPFGIAMGTPVSELRSIGATSIPGWHVLDSAPNPHSALSNYSVMASAKTGVCQVRARATYYEDPDGEQIMSTFKQLKDQLESKYGSTETISEMLDGPQIMEGGFQTHAYATWPQSDEAPLPDNLVAISLQAYPVQSIRQINLQYTFENFEQCQQDINNADENAL